MINRTRRELIVAALAGALTPRATRADDDKAQQDGAHAEKMAREHPGWMGHETVAMLIYPEFTALDLFGPQYMFASMMGAKVMLVAETLDPVPCDTGVKVLPTATFSDCPENLTILFVPGGTTGTLRAAENPAVRRFLADRGSNAQWITSVCTGSIVLGAAGLLRGYRATSHWIAREQLRLFGATPVDQRVVIDRNRVTGAGVTSGLDFGLSLVQKIRGTEYAQALQLLAEYDPRPPLDAGSEHKAPKAVGDMLRDMLREFNTKVEQLAGRLPSGPSVR